MNCNICDKHHSSAFRVFVPISYMSWHCSRHPPRTRLCAGWCIWRLICGCPLPGSTAVSQSFPSCLLLEPHPGLQGDLVSKELYVRMSNTWVKATVASSKIIHLNIFKRKRPRSILVNLVKGENTYNVF